MTKRYYTIRFEHTDGLNHSGDMLQNANNLLRIGQTESCDVRLENNSQYEDAVMAVIEKRPNDKGWKLIRTSPFREHEVRVNGTPINYVHFLNDGDRIAFEGQRQELVFNIREDELYTSSGIVPIGKSSNRSLIVWMAFISVALIGFVYSYLNDSPISDRMIEKAKQSVFQIKVDSVQLVVYRGNSDSVVLESTTVDNMFGTAFLTTDGMLVTARHCIEPWLNTDEKSGMDTVGGKHPKYVEMALKATTQNVIAEACGDSTRWKMVSFCSLRKADQSDTVVLKPKSSDFITDNSRDNVLELGDYSHSYFWRSITVRPHCVDMMLGDFAYIPHVEIPNYIGTIHLATKEDMRKLGRKPSRSINILGRTMSDTDQRKMKFESIETQLNGMFDDVDFTDDGYPNIVISITHNGAVKAGFSGGPVLTRQGLFKWCAIGLVSVKDKNNDNRLYSVPITEIERMEQKRMNNDER